MQRAIDHSPPVEDDRREEEQTQPPSPPPKTQTLSPKSKKRKWPSEADQTPIASPSAAENGGVGGSVGEKSEDEEDFEDFSLAQLIDKISRMKKNQMDIDVERLAGSKKVKFDGCVDMEDFVMKMGFELLGDEKRAEMEEAWEKLQVRRKKLEARKLALVGKQLMGCCLSDHSLSSLEEEEDCLSDHSLSSLEEEEEEEEEDEEEAEAEGEEEHMQQTEASINPAKEQVQMEEEDGKKEKSE